MRCTRRSEAQERRSAAGMSCLRRDLHLLHAQGPPEIRPPHQDLPCLRAAVRVAEEMGEGLGPGGLVLRALPAPGAAPGGWRQDALRGCSSAEDRIAMTRARPPRSANAVLSELASAIHPIAGGPSSIAP